MASQLRKRKRVADFVHAQIAPKNNCRIVGVNLKTEHYVQNTLAVRKRTDRMSESGSAKKKANLGVFARGKNCTRVL